MEKRINRLINKSFKKTLLDRPVPNKKVKFSLRGNKPKLETTKLLPEPLKPTKYTPPALKIRVVKKKLRIKPKTQLKQKPIPKPRIKSKRPVPLSSIQNERASTV